MREDVDGVARRSRAEGARRRVGDAARRARGGAEARARRERPGRPEGRDRRDPSGRRRRRGGDLGGRRATGCSPATPRAAASRPSCSRRTRARRGGFKEVVFAVKGDGAYSVFKYEGGTHRVQRVPETESQGRIHTSTATVAVMPEVGGGRGRDRRERPQDRRLPLHRAGRPERQHDRLGRPDHAPADRDRRRDAGREVAAPEQGEGAARAARPHLRGRARAPAGRALGGAASSQIGSGERAEKIRTYNYPDSRATDHRVKVTLNLEKVLPGGLDDFTEALQAEDRRRGARGAALTVGEVLRRATEHLGKTSETGAARCRAPARAHARAAPDRALHRLRPAARARAELDALSRGSSRAARGTSRSPTSSASGGSAG